MSAGFLFLALLPATSGAEARPTCFGRRATIVGTPRADRLAGTRGPDVIFGGAGGDVLIGNGGRDLLCGGSGDDELLGHYEEADRGDSVHGGPGADVCSNATAGRACEKTPTFDTARAALWKLAGTFEVSIDYATGAGDVDGDGELDLLVGSAGADEGAGVVTLLRGPLDESGTVRLRTAEDAVRFRGAHGAAGESEGDQASLVAAGDVNGDGLSDLVVGAPGSDTDTANDAGRAYVIFGRGDMEDVDLTTFDLGAQGGSGFQVTGPGDGGIGMRVEFLGDVNGDGLGDLVLGWCFGHTYVVFGKTDTRPVDLRLFDVGLQANAGYRIESSSDGNQYEVAPAGDVNGDGLDDLVFSHSKWAPDSNGPLDAERVQAWISYGKADTSNVDRAELTRTGTRFEWTLTTPRIRGVGDVNGDGFDDVAFMNAPRSGDGRLLTGAADMPAKMSMSFDSPFVLDLWFASTSSGEGPPAAVGDVNGDGLDDLAFGTTSTASRPGRRNVYTTLKTRAGSVFTVFGTAGARRPLAGYALGRRGVRYMGPPAPRGCRPYCFDANLLDRVAYLGDVNGDGANDLFVFSRHGDRGFVVLSPRPASRS